MGRSRADRPNVVVFFTDQQRWDTTGLHDNPLDLTPNLDRHARRGTHLVNFFTNQPVCGPSRACLQTGRYATATGCFRNDIPLPGERRTLAHHFRAAGYATAYIGKWHLADPRTHGPVAQEQRGGYEYWLAANVLEFTSEAYRTTLYDGSGDPVELPGYRVDALCDAAIRYIAGHRDEPFYLFLSLLEPHHQNPTGDYPAPEGYRERYAGRWMPPDLAALGGSAAQHIAGYFGMVKRLDEAFGRLMDALRSLAVEQDTIVLFTSDHGCHFHTRNREYKRSPHDASIRVPAVLLGPAFDRGTRVRELVSTVDLAPTLLDAAGLTVPADLDGRSVLPLLGGGAEWPGEVFIQVSEDHVGRAVRTHRWKYAVVAPGAHGWRDAGSGHYREEFLYDLRADPYELTNLAGLASHQGVAEVMRGRLIHRMAAAGETEPVIEPAAARPGGQRTVTPEETLE
ncbi:MAG: sulfatase-like hydrolase/transferase [Carbonactinosporaceae bacterium]